MTAEAASLSTLRKQLSSNNTTAKATTPRKKDNQDTEAALAQAERTIAELQRRYKLLSKSTRTTKTSDAQTQSDVVGDELQASLTKAEFEASAWQSKFHGASEKLAVALEDLAQTHEQLEEVKRHLDVACRDAEGARQNGAEGAEAHAITLAAVASERVDARNAAEAAALELSRVAALAAEARKGEQAARQELESAVQEAQREARLRQEADESRTEARREAAVARREADEARRDAKRDGNEARLSAEADVSHARAEAAKAVAEAAQLVGEAQRERDEARAAARAAKDDAAAAESNHAAALRAAKAAHEIELADAKDIRRATVQEAKAEALLEYIEETSKAQGARRLSYDDGFRAGQWAWVDSFP